MRLWFFTSIDNSEKVFQMTSKLFVAVFSRRFFCEKRPTIRVFFRQPTISLLLGHFSYNRNYYHKAKSGQRKLVQKGPPFIFHFFQRNLQNRTRLKGPPFEFFRHYATFLPKFLQCLKRVPFPDL